MKGQELPVAPTIVIHLGELPTEEAHEEKMEEKGKKGKKDKKKKTKRPGLMGKAMDERRSAIDE